MATTTNFGWETPDDTDLVKDGAAAIRTLGGAIDTSLVDLKGGTTGQVLSKASNTDMDFTWVAQDDSNAIQNAIVDAKGDLISATANDTPARLAVGNNGETLVADSSTSTGLRWQSNFAAGRNFSINGGVDIWQRGTTFTNTVGYTADRWYQGANNVTTTQETSSVPSGFRYAIKGTATASAQPYYMQAIETSEAVKLAGQTVVLSYYAATSDSSNVLVRLDYSTGTDTGVQGSFTTIASHSVAASRTFTRVQKTFDIPSTAKTLRILVGATGNIANTAFFSFAGVQLEVGSIATGFTRAAGTLAGELAACQRYYWRSTSNEAYSNIALGFLSGTGNAIILVNTPVTMRVTPTSVDFASQQIVDSFLSTFSVSGIALSSGETISNPIRINASVSGATQGRACAIRNANTTSGYIGFSAEL